MSNFDPFKSSLVDLDIPYADIPYVPGSDEAISVIADYYDNVRYMIFLSLQKGVQNSLSCDDKSLLAGITDYFLKARKGKATLHFHYYPLIEDEDDLEDYGFEHLDLSVVEKGRDNVTEKDIYALFCMLWTFGGKMIVEERSERTKKKVLYEFVSDCCENFASVIPETSDDDVRQMYADGYDAKLVQMVFVNTNFKKEGY